MVLVSPWVPLASGAGSARCNRLARLPGLVHSVIGSVLSGSVPQYIGYVSDCVASCSHTSCHVGLWLFGVLATPCGCTLATNVPGRPAPPKDLHICSWPSMSLPQTDTLCSAEVKPLPTGGLAVLCRGRRARRSGRRGVQGSTPAWPRRSPQQGSAKAGCRRASMLVLRRHMVLLSHAACQTVIACCLTSCFAAKAGKAVLTLLLTEVA